MNRHFCLTCHAGDIQNPLQLLNELEEVIDWMSFGVYLGLTVSTLKQIQKDQLTTDRCRRKMLLTWGKEQTPTWLKVIQALVKIRMFHLAVKIASKYGKFLQSARDTYTIYLQHFCTVCEISIYVAANIYHLSMHIYKA